MYDQLYQYHVLLNKLQSDTIILNIPVSTSDRPDLSEKIEKRLGDDFVIAKPRKQAWSGKNTKISASYLLKLKDGRKRPKVYVEVADPLEPSKLQDSRLRLTFEASKLSSNNRKIVRKFLIKLLGQTEFERIPIYGYFTRLDFCVDLPYWTPDHIRLHYAKATRSRIKVYRNGGTAVQVTGTGPISKVTGYDKGRQLQDKHRLNNPISTVPVLRLEVTVKRKLFFNDLYQLENPFELVNIYSTNLSRTTFSEQFRADFIDQGVYAALHNSGQAPEELAKLGQYEIHLIDDHLWSQLSAALDFLDIFYASKNTSIF